MSPLTVIIPTKNRPDALERTVGSILAQSKLPDEWKLIVIDQSAGEESRRRIEAMGLPSLDYMHNPAIRGVSAARNAAMECAEEGIWLFLDDDVVLEPDFIQQLLAVYQQYPEVSGVAGLITNYVHVGTQIWRRTFVRGPFQDERQPIYWRAKELRNSKPIGVRWFTGAAMSFRSVAIGKVRFADTLRTAEDMDFCLRLRAGALVIAPRAGLLHLRSPIGRSQEHWLRQHAHDHVFLYRKHFRKHRIAYCWLLCGYIVAIVGGCVLRLSDKPLRAMCLGIKDVRNGQVKIGRTSS